MFPSPLSLCPNPSPLATFPLVSVSMSMLFCFVLFCLLICFLFLASTYKYRFVTINIPLNVVCSSPDDPCWCGPHLERRGKMSGCCRSWQPRTRRALRSHVLKLHCRTRGCGVTATRAPAAADSTSHSYRAAHPEPASFLRLNFWSHWQERGLETIEPQANVPLGAPGA